MDLLLSTNTHTEELLLEEAPDIRRHQMLISPTHVQCVLLLQVNAGICCTDVTVPLVKIDGEVACVQRCARQVFSHIDQYVQPTKMQNEYERSMNAQCFKSRHNVEEYQKNRAYDCYIKSQIYRQVREQHGNDIPIKLNLQKAIRIQVCSLDTPSKPVQPPQASYIPSLFLLILSLLHTSILGLANILLLFLILASIPVSSRDHLQRLLALPEDTKLKMRVICGVVTGFCILHSLFITFQIWVRLVGYLLEGSSKARIQALVKAYKESTVMLGGYVANGIRDSRL